MITLDSIKGTWIEKPLNTVLICSNTPIREAETLPKCELPKYLRVPASRGGTTKITIASSNG